MSDRRYEMDSFMQRQLASTKSNAVEQLIEIIKTLPESKVKQYLKEIQEWKETKQNQ